MSETDEFYFQGRLPGYTYYSKRIRSIFGLPVSPRRFFYRVVNGHGGVIAVRDRGEIVLREGASGRFQLKATLYEDDQQIGNLTLQKWNQKGGPHKEIAFSLRGREIDELLQFVRTAETLLPLGEEGGRVADQSLVQTTLDRRQIAKTLLAEPDLLEAVLQADVRAQDIFGLARRRRSLAYFGRMLDDDEFRKSEERANGGPEAVWQSFFERNTWIFGYGLSYIALANLDGRSLRSKVAGYNIGGRGKEVDAVMKTRAVVNSLCFVEIKGAEAPLVREYRAGVYAPTSELAGATSQLQVNVQRALEELTEEFRPDNPSTGDPTGETLFQFQPRSFLVIGNLRELASEHGPHKAKFRSFELYRRSLRWPEIITFDELYARARFIVEDGDYASLVTSSNSNATESGQS